MDFAKAMALPPPAALTPSERETFTKAPVSKKGESLGKLRGGFNYRYLRLTNEGIDRCMIMWRPSTNDTPPRFKGVFELAIRVLKKKVEVADANPVQSNGDQSVAACISYALRRTVPIPDAKPAPLIRVLYPVSAIKYPMSFYHQKYTQAGSPYHPRNWKRPQAAQR